MKQFATQPKSHTYPILLACCMLALIFWGLYQSGIQSAAAYAIPDKEAAASSEAAAYLPFPTISFLTTGTTVGEGVGSVTIQVRVSQAPTTTATVRYITFAGSAGSSDYVTTQGTLTFPVASTSDQTITVQITEDTLPEPAENFRLFLYEPVNATVVAPNDFAIVITDNDPVPTPTPTGGAPIFADALEPNNNFNEASNVDAGATARCNLTFFPPGDQDFFRWWGQAGISYRVFTRDLTAGIDTQLRVYNTNQNLIAENDDETPGSRNSSVQFTANVDGFYFARVVNTIPGDPVNKTYCFEVTRFIEPTPSPPPPSPPEPMPANSTAPSLRPA